MTRPLRRGVAALVLATSLAGCGLFGQDDPTVGRNVTAAPERATVTLLDAGSEPRRPVVLALEPGSTVDLVFAVDLHLTQRSSDVEGAQVLDPPTTTQTVRFTVERVDDTAAVVAFEVLDAGIDPTDTLLTDAQILELTAAVQPVIGLTGRMDVDAHGQVGSVRYDTPEGFPAEVAETVAALERSIATVVPALPAEPMGRGARWRNVVRTDVAGLTVRQTTEYELTALDDDRFLYRATIAQTAPEQALDPAGDAARLLAADLAGTTSGMVSLTSLASESETTLRGSQVVEQTTADGPPRRVTQELDIRVTVDPGVGGEP